MGQVDRATDTTLKRQAAIKILPPLLAADPDRQARFQREAEVLAPLNDMHRTGILMHMRTTLNIDDALLGRATELSGLREKTAVVRAGLEALVARESARRLAALGGTVRGVRSIPRRRPRTRRSR